MTKRLILGSAEIVCGAVFLLIGVLYEGSSSQSYWWIGFGVLGVVAGMYYIFRGNPYVAVDSGIEKIAVKLGLERHRRAGLSIRLPQMDIAQVAALS